MCVVGLVNLGSCSQGLCARAVDIRVGTTVLAAVLIASVVVVATLGCAEYLGKDADEEDSERRHAGTDDSDVGFDGGPFCYGEVFPCRVGAVCSSSDGGAETEDTHDCDAEIC